MTYIYLDLKFCGSLYPNTALVITPKKKSLAGEWPKLFRENNVEITRFDGGGGGGGVPLFLANFPNGERAAQ